MPDSKNGLNDTAATDVRTIRETVTAFRNSEAIKHLASSDKACREMAQRIDKYHERLYAGPITVHCAHGSTQVQPQRTNDLMEQLFRDLERAGRRRSGTCALGSRLTAVLPDMPMVRNLQCPNYMQIILYGEATLAQRFASIDRTQMRKQLIAAQEAAQKYPRHMGKLFKIPDLPDQLGHPKTSATAT